MIIAKFIDGFFSVQKTSTIVIMFHAQNSAQDNYIYMPMKPENKKEFTILNCDLK